jgi:Uncharacterized conserved protein
LWAAGDVSMIDWSGLIGLPNVLIHAYHRIQPDLLWQAATGDIPSTMGVRPGGCVSGRRR